MGEFTECFKERYTRSKVNNQRDLMEKQKVKNAILKSCEKYLQEAEDEYTFEVLPKDLAYALEAVMEEPLKSRYIINQISDTLFVAQLQKVDLDF